MIDKKLTMWTIFDRPLDFPNEFVIVCDVVGLKKGPVLTRLPHRWLARTLEEAREKIQILDPTADFCQPRAPRDPITIVETWY